MIFHPKEVLGGRDDMQREVGILGSTVGLQWLREERDLQVPQCIYISIFAAEKKAVFDSTFKPGILHSCLQGLQLWLCAWS